MFCVMKFNYLFNHMTIYTINDIHVLVMYGALNPRFFESTLWKKILRTTVIYLHIIHYTFFLCNIKL